MKYRLKWILTILVISVTILIITACDESKPTPESIVSGTKPSTAVLQNTPLSDTVISQKITPTIPSLTPLPIPKLFVLDVTSKGNAPADLLDFMFDYSGSAGGWGCNINGAPAWDTPLNGKVVAAIPQTLVWFAINLPGDADGQTLLTLPDGAVLPLEPFIRSDGCFKVQYEISPGALLGTYSINSQQDNIQLIDLFSLEMPEDPIQGVYQGNEWFSGFEPNEKVTLTIYYRNDINEFKRPDLAALFKELPDFTAFFNSNNFGSYNFLAYLDQQLVKSDENGSFLIGFTSDQLNSLDQFWKSRLRIVARGESSRNGSR